MTDAPDYSKFTPEATGEAEGLKEQLNALVLELMKAGTVVEDAQEKLKAAQTAYADLAEHQIPELMDKLGKKRFLTRSGLSIALKEGIRGGMPEATREEALQYLRANGHAALIKRELKLSFGMGQEEQAQTTVSLLVDQGLNPDSKVFVHPQTLNSWIKEQLGDGKDVPACFTYTQIREAKIG